MTGMTTAPTTIRVFLMDDHEIVRRGLADLIGLERDMEVVGEAGSTADALHRIPAARPDVAVLDVRLPDAGFYLWAAVPGHWATPELSADEHFAQALLAQYNVTVLPGSYLAREVNGFNPGRGRVRMALVAETAECLEAAERIARFVRQHPNKV